MKSGTYYLGRVHKAGISINQGELMDAIVSSKTITIGKYDWSITDVLDARREDRVGFVFGHLSKSSAEGTITIVDTAAKEQESEDVPDLLDGSSPFVYLPSCSGIAYLHVWNKIQKDVFVRRFKAIIEETFEKWFVDLDIEPISDYRTFSAKLSELERISHIRATVYPPNPLFGRFWAELDRYVKDRNAAEVRVAESQPRGAGLKTKLKELLEVILNDPATAPSVTPDIGDAAVLMAADGYGKGFVEGDRSGESIRIHTHESHKSFSFDKEPDPHELAEAANAQFQQISDERGLSH